MKLKNIFFAVLALSLVTSTAWAKPERLEIKKADQRSKEKAAKTQIKNIDLRNIEDPEARRAIREIMNYLNLNTRG